MFEPSCDSKDVVARDCKLPELQRFDRILQHAWVRAQPLLEPSSTLLLCLFILHIHELKTEAGENMPNLSLKVSYPFM